MGVGRLLVVVLMACAVSACSFEFSIGSDPAVEDVVLSTEIDDETSAPRNNFDAFPESVKVIYATVEIHELDEGETFTFRWLKGENIGQDVEYTLEEDIVQGWAYSSLELPNGLDVGDDYSVEVYRNDKLESSKVFSIEADE